MQHFHQIKKILDFQSVSDISVRCISSMLKVGVFVGRCLSFLHSYAFGKFDLGLL